MILRHGDTGPAVEALQRKLIRAGVYTPAGGQLRPDGIYGETTEAVVRAYQLAHDLVGDGIAGPRTLAMLDGRKPANPQITQSDLARAARTLRVDVTAIMAVTEVETIDDGFVAPNRPAILFERHIMYRQMKQAGLDVKASEKLHPNIVNHRPGGYSGGLLEHIRLIRAQKIHAPSAPESASWGLFQIMGFHWERLGYDSQYAFADAMTAGEAEQLDAFVRFIEADKVLHQALREHDWPAFAAGYNGPAYEKNDYDTRLAAAYRRHQAALALPESKPAKKRKRAKAKNEAAQEA